MTTQEKIEQLKQALRNAVGTPDDCFGVHVEGDKTTVWDTRLTHVEPVFTDFDRLIFGDEFMDALSHSQRLTDLFYQAVDEVQRSDLVVHDPSSPHQTDPLERFVEEVRGRFQEMVVREMGL